MTHGSEKRIRNRHRTIRFSPEELEIIDAAADRTGLMFGSYVRQVLLGAPVPRQVRRPPVEKRELARILGAIGHVGGNLNQLAKASNSGIVLYANEVSGAADAIIEIRDAVMKALGRTP